MTTTLFLLRIMGPTILALGISIVLYKDKYASAMKAFREFNFLYVIAAIIPLVVGLAIILKHNLWATPPQIIVSLIGWAAFLKGVLRLLAPDFVFTMIAKLSKNVLPWGFVVLLLGAWLTYQGYAGYFLVPSA